MVNRELLLSLFQTCNGIKSASQLHCLSFLSGFIHDSFFATKLISLYGKFSLFDYARKLFDETPQRSVYLWNALLRNYCTEKRFEETLSLFCYMITDPDEEKPDNYTIPVVLKACAGLKLCRVGEMIHGFAKKVEKSDSDMFVGAALVELYSKCGKMNYALKVFDEFPQPDVVLWTSMVTGYEQNDDPEQALSFFSKMVMAEHVDPDRVTLVSLASACAQLLNLKLGLSIHGFMIRRSFDSDISSMNSMLNLYSKTGSINFATNLFRKMPKKDVISWSSMIGCYTHNGDPTKALYLFNKMIDKKLELNSVIMVTVLQACAVSRDLHEGKKNHKLCEKLGFDHDISVCTALIDMYMKCLAPNEAIKIFEKIPKKDVVSWGVLLSGYAQNGMAHKSMDFFCVMLRSNMKPDAIALVRILSSCSKLGHFHQALCLHGYVIKTGFYSNNFVNSSLIELYSKCGDLENALRIFHGLVEKDVVTWSSMIGAYGIHGQAIKALNLFNLMIKSTNITPNEVTFLSILSSCSHSGLIKEGIHIFDLMINEYKLEPNLDHYSIMVDLFGRIGDLNKAMEVINNMPIHAGPHVWGALLGACRIHQNVEIGNIASKNISRLDPSHAGYYILLSNMYAVDGDWDNAEKVRSTVKKKGLKKMTGQSTI